MTLSKTNTPLFHRSRLFIVGSVAIVDGSDARNCARNVVEHALDNMRSHPKTCHTGRSGAPQIVQPPPRCVGALRQPPNHLGEPADRRSMRRGEDKITVEKARHLGEHLLCECAKRDHVWLAVLRPIGGYDPFVALALSPAH